MESVVLLLGLCIVSAGGYDFFYTTLSGSGAAFITRTMLILSHKIQLGLSRIFGRKVFQLSGMLVNLGVLSVWILLIWFGLFLVFSSQPEDVVNSGGRAATTVERLYFTGYVLSTLGLGNFKPSSPFFELLVSLFSFFGFIFFSAAMTYLLSVSSAVTHKRALALSIRNLGENPGKVIKSLQELTLSQSYQQIVALQQMIDRHNVNHQAYPVLHYYNSSEIASALSINLTVLDEAVSMLLYSQDKPLYHELQSLRSSLDQFLRHIQEKFRHGSKVDYPDISWENLDLPPGLPPFHGSEVSALSERRKVLSDLLKSEALGWSDVYPASALKTVKMM
uniref:Ion channel n=1 Tax=Roseihalotalea indica TaxID=2867963 RepID=A0AA49GRJ9_9BACT|nr:ion channel [Tunicatimonas sp. TK19036]